MKTILLTELQFCNALTLIRMGISKAVYSVVGFIYHEELIQYHYNFLQLLTNLLKLV